jgi:ABC-type Fe3+ transport system permease subunit
VLMVWIECVTVLACWWEYCASRVRRRVCECRESLRGAVWELATWTLLVGVTFVVVWLVCCDAEGSLEM